MSVKHYWKQLQNRAIFVFCARSLVLILTLLAFWMVGVSLALTYRISYEWIRRIGWTVLIVGPLWIGWKGYQSWYPWSTLSKVAYLLERQVPSLEGRSVLALDQNPKPSVLRERALERAVSILNSFSLTTFISWKPLKQAMNGFLFSTFVLVLTHLGMPISPFQVFSVFANQQQYQFQQSQGSEIDAEAEVVLGDIVLRYTFPAYTQMTPVEIPNADGDIRAPQDTRVKLSAKTLERYQSVAIQINEEQPIAAMLNFGREVEAEILLQKEGQYRLLFFDGERQIPTKYFELVFDQDDPPVVTLTLRNPTPEIPENHVLKLKWSAADDFGLERVILEVEKEGKVQSVLLRKFTENRLKIEDQMKVSFEELGLKGGDTARISVVAYDNQRAVDTSEELEVGQPFGKRGVSEPVEITILTPEMTADELQRFNIRLRDAVVRILATFLVEDVPQTGQLLKWSKQRTTHYTELRTLFDEAWSRGRGVEYSYGLTKDLLDNSASLFRFVLTTYGQERVGEPKEEDYAFFKQTYRQHIDDLEFTIYILDYMLRQVAYTELSRNAKQLLKDAERLADSADGMMELNVQEISVRLDAIQKSFVELEGTAQQLLGSSMGMFVENRLEVLNYMHQTLQNEMGQVEFSIFSAHTHQFVDAVQQFKEDLDEMIERAKQQQEEQQQEMESLIEKLEELDAQQLEMMMQLSSAREEDPAAQALGAQWKKIQNQVEKGLQAAEDAVERIGDGTGLRSGSIRAVENLARGVQRLDYSIVTRDIQGVYEDLLYLERDITRASNVLENERQRARPASEAKPSDLNEMAGDIQVVQQMMQTIAQQLDSEAMRYSESSPQLQAAAEGQHIDQVRLTGELRTLLPDIEKAEQQIITSRGEGQKFAMEGVKSMEDASEHLKEGDLMGGESLQFQSSARIQDTIEALKQASSSMQDMQRQMSAMSSGEYGEGGEGGEGEDMDFSSNLEIPKRKLSPEEYRKLLMDGMQGAVPEEYQLMKKRYYEELVAQ